MFHDQHFRLTIKIGVAYGSPCEQVKQILHDTVLEHPEVLKGKEDTPQIFFMEYGESSLLFEVWCFIPNVNDKFVILTDLHIMIGKAFDEANIVIAFPQQDVYIKSLPS